ncbi:MFS transporter [Paenibacillus sp. SC116]|uniref:MFS transporter n=1 Tax=Paenibacillus sp. SC116 TaxID=2968986 RepID=UPI00215A137E|nr:MFS transporter [Paenibacillus sp. SC116]MCR8842477.1 MFS transporter [Paenibacillus sp. SC116]
MKKNTLAAHNIKMLFWLTILQSTSFIAPVLTLFYYARDMTGAQILLMPVFWSLSLLLGEVPAGVYADRFNAKISFMTGTFIRIVGVSILLFANEPWLFYLSAILSGLSVAFFSGSDQALIYDSLKESGEEDRMDKAIGKIQSGTFIATFFAVVTGAILARDLRDEQFILLIVLGLVLIVASIFFILRLRVPQNQQEVAVDGSLATVLEGIKVIRQAPQLLFMVLNATLVFTSGVVAFELFDQPFLNGAGLPVEYIGLMYGAGAVLGFFSSHTIGWLTQRISRISLLFMTGLLAASSLLLAGLFGNILILALTVFLALKFVSAVRVPIYSQLSNDLIPSHVRATTISLLSIIDGVLDLIVFGTLTFFAVGGISSIYIVCAGIALLGTLLPIRKVKETMVVSSSEVSLEHK